MTNALIVNEDDEFGYVLDTTRSILEIQIDPEKLNKEEITIGQYLMTYYPSNFHSGETLELTNGKFVYVLY